MHRAHQGAVLQGGEAEVERSQQVRVLSGHGVLQNRRVHFTGCQGLNWTLIAYGADDKERPLTAQ
ncbi:hypothetical protein D3C84_965470 [compost metagenome]